MLKPDNASREASTNTELLSRNCPKIDHFFPLAAIAPGSFERRKSTSETYSWLIESTSNYEYAIAYGLELIEEFKKRYTKLHRTEGVLLWLKENVPDIPEGKLTKNVGLAMPEKYKDRNDVTRSYKNYIIHEKSKVVSWKRSKVPDWYDLTLHDVAKSTEKFVYTDGATLGNGIDHCRAGYAVWFSEDDSRNCSGIVRDNPSDQTAELTAIKKALEAVRGEQYTIVTDSQYCINCLTRWIDTWKANGWMTSSRKPVKHKGIIESAANMLNGHRLLYVNSHMPQPDTKSSQWKNWYGNSKADAMANQVVGLVWYSHPDSSEYAYTKDIELDMRYPLMHVESGLIVATVDDEGVKPLTARDIATARTHQLSTGRQI